MGKRIAAIVGIAHAEERVPSARRSTKHPAWIARPSSAGEIAELVRLAAVHDAAVIPVGTELRDSKGEPDSSRRRIFIDLRRMRHVLSLDETSLVVHAQAGLTALALEEILENRGLSLGDYPPATLSSTIGGLLAVRTPGKSSRRHGFIEDAVLGASGVLADGRTVHTRVAPRRATGPDLARALCGSEGTLGIITSATLRIHRRPEARYWAAYWLPSVADALSAVHLALREEAAPSAMRAYDADEAVAHLGPDLAGKGAVLVVATSGPTDLAACDRDLVASAVQAVGGSDLPEEVAHRWWARRTGQATHSAPRPHLQVSATPSRQRAVYQAVVETAAAESFRVRSHASRFDVDGGVLFFTLTDQEGERLTGQVLERAHGLAEGAAAKAGGYLLGRLGNDMGTYFKELRDRLDPNHIMNPGALRPDARADAQPEPDGA